MLPIYLINLYAKRSSPYGRHGLLEGPDQDQAPNFHSYEVRPRSPLHSRPAGQATLFKIDRPAADRHRPTSQVTLPPHLRRRDTGPSFLSRDLLWLSEVLPTTHRYSLHVRVPQRQHCFTVPQLHWSWTHENEDFLQLSFSWRVLAGPSKKFGSCSTQVRGEQFFRENKELLRSIKTRTTARVVDPLLQEKHLHLF